MKTRSTLSKYIKIILLIVLPAIVLGCSDSNDGDLRNLIKNKSNIQKVEYRFYNTVKHKLEVRTCDATEEAAIIDYILSLSFDEENEEDIPLYFTGPEGGIWAKFYLTDGRELLFVFRGPYFSFYELLEVYEDEITYYSDSTGNAEKLVEYLSNLERGISIEV